ncbi:MAG TPA: 16S rRNA (uracil(1498)-N(3))-methyltransferase [Bacteroidales bacterium]|nr:16S rRNA (uracil(1498)-N(3))-methyltransferase [Bacteroidales bacterium]
MQIFYAPGIKGTSYMLNEMESKHCIRVLRMTKGSLIRLIDGKGTFYEGEISDPDPKKCQITILEVKYGFEKRNYKLHIAISPLKNTDRFEWFVEKSVEIGVDEITPIICKLTEKQSIKHERIENIIISAMKQSLKALKPVINEPLSFDDFIKQSVDGLRMIAHCKSYPERVKISEACKKSDNAIIMVGPEGDFSEDELATAVNYGFTPIHLGTSRLRTETAGIAACHSIYFINQ